MLRRIIMVLLGAVLIVGFVQPAQAHALDECKTFKVCGRIVNHKNSKTSFVAYRDFCSKTAPCKSSPTDRLYKGDEDVWADADGLKVPARRWATISNGAESLTVYGGTNGKYVKLGNRPLPLKWVVYIK